VDCDRNGIDQGCSGGMMDDAFSYVRNMNGAPATAAHPSSPFIQVIKTGGLALEADYPYHARNEHCNKSVATSIVVIDSFVDVPPNDEKSLMKAVSQQPIAIALCASQLTFQLYHSGILSGGCVFAQTRRLHAALCET